jgi:hypothetical protein
MDQEQPKSPQPLLPDEPETTAEESPPVDSPVRQDEASPSSQTPEIQLPRIAPQRPSGCSQWGNAGCLIGLGLLIIALAAGYFTLDTGFFLLVKRAQQQIWDNLPRDLDQQQRTRTLNNLNRLSEKLKEADDPNYLIGEFLGKAATALEDQKLTHDEVETLNLYLESVTGAGAGNQVGPEQP